MTAVEGSRDLFCSPLSAERETRTQRAGGMCPTFYHKVSFHETSSIGQRPFYPQMDSRCFQWSTRYSFPFLSPFFIVVRFPTLLPPILTLCWGHKGSSKPSCDWANHSVQWRPFPAKLVKLTLIPTRMDPFCDP